MLLLPDNDRVGRIREYRNPLTRSFAEFAIDAKEDKYARAVLVGILREASR